MQKPQNIKGAQPQNIKGFESKWGDGNGGKLNVPMYLQQVKNIPNLFMRISASIEPTDEWSQPFEETMH